MRLRSLRKIGRFFMCGLFFHCLVLKVTQVSAQSDPGILRGFILDGSTFKPICTGSVTNDSTSISTSLSDGSYTVSLMTGNYTLTFSSKGFQSKVISGISVRTNEVTTFDVILYPLQTNSTFNKKPPGDSISEQAALKNADFISEGNMNVYNVLYGGSGRSDRINATKIDPGLERNGPDLISHLNGVIVQTDPAINGLESINISGMGERYNQLLLNGSQVNSLSNSSRLYPLSLIPVEAIESASLDKTGKPSVLADFVGGTVSIV